MDFPSSEGNLAEIRTVGLKEFLYESEENPNYMSGNDWQFCVLSSSVIVHSFFFIRKIL